MITSPFVIFVLTLLSLDHTLCQFPGIGPACGKPSARGLSDKEKNLVLDYHNQLRAKVANGQETRGRSGSQPPAADMLEFQWDDEIANMAQRWADQCTFGHDKNRKVARFQVGQNVYQASSSRNYPIDFKNGINGWYDEVSDFDKSGIDRFRFSSGVGHYTQIVWSATRFIGCGAISYKGGRWINNYIVCNYGPAGNFIGRKMYTRGPACSACPPGTSCSQKHPGLCAGQPQLPRINPQPRFLMMDLPPYPFIPPQPNTPPQPVPPILLPQFNQSVAPSQLFPQAPQF